MDIVTAEKNLEQALVDLRGAKDGRGLLVYLRYDIDAVNAMWVKWCATTKASSRKDEAAAARNLALVANAYAARLEYDLLAPPPELPSLYTADMRALLG